MIVYNILSAIMHCFKRTSEHQYYKK